MDVNLSENEATSESNGQRSPGKFNLSFDIPQTAYIQCFICGHKNPANVGICEMCSNYLFTSLNGKRGRKE